MLEGERGELGVGDEVAADLIAPEQVAQEVGVAPRGAGIQAAAAPSQSLTRAQASSGVSGRSKTSGQVAIRTKVVRV